MYMINEYHGMVRDRGKRYRDARPAREPLPAETALEDLAGDPTDGDARRVLARYCVLRYIQLRETAAEAALVEHARLAASEYLDAADAAGRWTESPDLRALVEREEPVVQRVARLRHIGRRAGRSGCGHAAATARYTARLLARRRLLLNGRDPA